MQMLETSSLWPRLPALAAGPRRQDRLQYQISLLSLSDISIVVPSRSMVSVIAAPAPGPRTPAPSVGV